MVKPHVEEGLACPTWQGNPDPRSTTPTAYRSLPLLRRAPLCLQLALRLPLPLVLLLLPPPLGILRSLHAPQPTGTSLLGVPGHMPRCPAAAPVHT